MSAIRPAGRRVWWQQPVEPLELTWIFVAILWCLFLFLMSPYRDVFGKQNSANGRFRTTPAEFSARTQAMVDRHTVREEEIEMGGAGQVIPVVRPPAGSDVYLIARLWQWWPLLELEEGQSYRLHLMSMDWPHGFSLRSENLNLRIDPGDEHLLNLRPSRAGTYSILCNEYCGINHHTMVSRLHVVANK